MNININLSRRVLKKIIKYLILFVLGCITVFYVNTLNVKAETINNTSSSINQACSTPSRYTYSLANNSNFSTGTFSTTYSGVADYLVFSFNYSLLGNSTYSLSISANGQDFRNISKTNTFLYNVSSCADVSTQLDITNVSFSLSKIVITFKTISNSSRFLLAFGSDGGPAITGVSNFGISSIDITTIESDDTKNIIDNNNQNTQSIIDNNNQNTQDIIDNQNKNNEELKDTLDSSLNNCRDSYNLFNPSGGNLINGKGISSDGSIINDTTGSYYDYFIPVSSSTTYNLSNKDNVIFAGSWFFAYYDNNKNFISLNKLGESSTNFTFTTSSNVSYIRLYSYLNLANVNSLNNIMLSKGSSKINFENYGQVCTSKLDDTNAKLDNLNSNLTDSSDPNLAIGDVAGWLPPGPVDSVLNLPLTILNSLISNLSNRTCTAVDVPLPYIDKSIQLPCLSTIFQKTGFTDVLNTISIPFAIFIYINTLIKLYGWVDKTLQFREEHWNDVDQWGGI